MPLILTGVAQDNFFNLLGDKSSLEIPFAYHGGFIIMEATINKKEKLKFILDTGAENIILFDLAKARSLEIKEHKKINLWGSDLENNVPAYISRQNKISLHGTESIIKDFLILEDDILNLANLIGIPIDGLIGGRMFWGLVVTINYKKGKLKITKKEAFDKKAIPFGYQAIDLEIVNHKPYIKSKIDFGYGGDISVKLLIDTGSALGMLILLNTHESLILPSNHIMGPLGHGLGGSIEGYICRIKSLRLTPSLFFPQPVSYFQKLEEDLDANLYNSRNGLLGNPILSRFTVIIDYVDSKMYLKPNKKYNKKILFDRSGLIVIATGEHLNKYLIKTVLKGSPAEAIGLQAGDYIKRLGWRSTRSLRLHGIARKLHGDVGKIVRVVIEREGIKMIKKLILEDYL